MQLRRKARARHRAESEEDMVIDLRERLAPYDRIPNTDPERDEPEPAPRRRTRPLRSR